MAAQKTKQQNKNRADEKQLIEISLSVRANIHAQYKELETKKHMLGSSSRASGTAGEGGVGWEPRHGGSHTEGKLVYPLPPHD